MKNKLLLYSLIIWEVFCILVIYGIGGSLAPWIWTIGIYVIAPIACIITIVEIIVILYRKFKKKKFYINLMILLLSLVASYPITVLFGISKLTYPRKETIVEEYSMEAPIEDGIYLGGKEYTSHAVWPSECYAYDIVKIPHDIGSTSCNDYGIYLAPVNSPVNGTVIAMVDTEEDILPNSKDFTSSLGNYIVIEIEETKTYLILAHLEKDSSCVDVGDLVHKGMLLANVGNSGTTSEPHLHMQHQKQNPLTQKLSIVAEGLPIVIE